MKSIYVLLTRSNTIPARLIYWFTKDCYTHVSLGLDRDLHKLYSFARRNLYCPLIAGFIKESIHNGVFLKYGNNECRLYELEVSDEVYFETEKRIDVMIKNYDRYRYNFIGFFLYLFNIPFRREYNFCCSQFVAKVLAEAGVISCDKDWALMKPIDFLNIPELKLVYQGSLENCDMQMTVC